MQPTPAEVLALLLRMLKIKHILTADEVDEITMWSQDWETEVYDRDHDTQEMIR